MKSKARKLLVASIGIATVSYIGCAGSTFSDPPTSGNLPAPRCLEECQVDDSGAGGDSGDAHFDTGIPPTSGNLPAPAPMDAGNDADASHDASDGR